MADFKVWDELDGPESNASTISALNASEAAIIYAERDQDGRTDGIYTHRGFEMANVERNGHPICVRAADGTLQRFRVGIVEFQAVFAAAQVMANG